MPYIPLEDHLPGITGLLEFRQEPAKPIRGLTQFLLRGPSTLSEVERELIATIVSFENSCAFCTRAHAETAVALSEHQEIAELIMSDLESAPISEKLKALLQIAKKVQSGGKNVLKEDIERATSAGVTDVELHDTVLIASLFCMYNRYVDGLSTVTPVDQSFYSSLANRLVNNGYNRLPGGYTHQKKT